MAYSSIRSQGLACSLLSLAAFLATSPSQAAVYSYVDWTEADVASGTAAGTITLPDDSTVSVTFEAINEDGSAGSLHGAQTSDGTNFWLPDAPYLSDEVENAPPTPDILQLSGGLNQTYRVTLSEPVKDPLMAIVSLGQPSIRCTYEFDSPFTIVSQGAGYWGGNANALSALEGNILEGYEGHGTLRFLGTFDEFSWTVPTPEAWHGFTFAIRTTERLEPTPGAGGAGGAGGADAGGADAGGAGGTSAGGEPNTAGGALGDGGTGLTGEAGSGDERPQGEGGQAPTAGAGAGGQADEEERPLAGDDAGCNCSVPRGGLPAPLAAVAALLAGALWRRSRRARQSRV